MLRFLAKIFKKTEIKIEISKIQIILFEFYFKNVTFNLCFKNLMAFNLFLLHNFTNFCSFYVFTNFITAQQASKLIDVSFYWIIFCKCYSTKLIDALHSTKLIDVSYYWIIFCKTSLNEDEREAQ